MSKQAEAAGYFQEAASLQLHYSPMSAIICHQHAAQCFLLQRAYLLLSAVLSTRCSLPLTIVMDAGDYVSAINAYNTIVSLIASSAVDPQGQNETLLLLSLRLIFVFFPLWLLACLQISMRWISTRRGRPPSTNSALNRCLRKRPRTLQRKVRVRLPA